MRLFLIRHAVTPETGKVLTGRLPGVGLSESGVQMADTVASHLIAQRITTVYTSPIQRCQETAKAVGRELGLKPIVDKRFQEVDYGKWAGRKLGDLYKLKAWRGLFVAASRFRFPDGETLEEVRHRTTAGVEDLVGKHPKGKVAVVSHSDVIRVLLANYLGMPLDLIHRLDVLPASVSIIDLPKGGPPRVSVVNHVADIERWR